MRTIFLLLALCCCACAFSAPVALQNATATFSQTSFAVGTSIDGSYDSGANGWAISASIVYQVAVWETVTDLNCSKLTLDMYQLHSNPYHMLGCFRWSVTTADRSTFANGLANGGDVDTTWTILTNAQVTGASGTVFTNLGDNSILVSGTNPGTGSYSVVYNTNLTNITGIRLEVIENASLPSSGPGRASNGNFVLTELVVSAVPVPEPSTLALFSVSILGLFFYGKRK